MFVLHSEREFEVVTSSLLKSLFEFVHAIVRADLNLGIKKKKTKNVFLSAALSHGKNCYKTAIESLPVG